MIRNHRKRRKYDYVFCITFSLFQGLKVTPEEGAVLAKAFSRKKYDDFRAQGIRAAGKKYIFLRSDDDDRIVVARCKDETLTMQKSKTGKVSHAVQ